MEIKKNAAKKEYAASYDIKILAKNKTSSDIKTYNLRFTIFCPNFNDKKLQNSASEIRGIVIKPKISKVEFSETGLLRLVFSKPMTKLEDNYPVEFLHLRGLAKSSDVSSCEVLKNGTFIHND